MSHLSWVSFSGGTDCRKQHLVVSDEWRHFHCRLDGVITGCGCCWCKRFALFSWQTLALLQPGPDPAGAILHPGNHGWRLYLCSSRVPAVLVVRLCVCVSGPCHSVEDFLSWSISTCLAASSSLRWGCRSLCQPVLPSMMNTSITVTTSTVTQEKLPESPFSS